MEITCENCRAQFKIPDEKLPKDKLVAVPCPKCKEKITVDTRAKNHNGKPPAPANGKTGKNLADEVISGQYDASDKPFDYIDEGTLTALVCDADSGNKARVRAALENMHYRVTEASTAREALKAMRFHIFDMVVLNEMFDTDNAENNHVLKFLGRLTISTRRQIFLVLLCSEHRTMDNMASFTKSVNIIINLKNIDEIGSIISTGVSENNGFYRTFNDTLKKMGRL
ncbi:MAG: zinc-ribbon domain-containing protein [Deltaproteobacteria bacterium]|nr:zinc-ribbon domain-containing protein [Deltaproteobacteria bacterium]